MGKIRLAYPFVLFVDRLLRINNFKPELIMKTLVLGYDRSGKTQIALKCARQTSDVLSGFVKFDFAGGGNPLCTDLDRRIEIKHHVRLPHARIQLRRPIWVDASRCVPRNTCEYVTVRQDDFSLGQGRLDHSFVSAPEVRGMKAGIGGWIQGPSGFPFLDDVFEAR